MRNIIILLLFSFFAQAQVVPIYGDADIYGAAYVRDSLKVDSVTVLNDSVYLNGLDGTGNIIGVYSDGRLYKVVAATVADSSLWERSGGNLYPKTITDEVGVGTTNPTYQLDVAGNTRALFGIYQLIVDSSILGSLPGGLLISNDGAGNILFSGVGNFGPVGLPAGNKAHMGWANGLGTFNSLYVDNLDMVGSFRGDIQLSTDTGTYSLAANDVFHTVGNSAIYQNAYADSNGNRYGFSFFGETNTLDERTATVFCIDSASATDLRGLHIDDDHLGLHHFSSFTDANNYVDNIIHIEDALTRIVRNDSTTSGSSDGGIGWEFNDSGHVLPTDSGLQNIGVGSRTVANLYVNNIQYLDGNAGVGNILYSDASGNASWSNKLRIDGDTIRAFDAKIFEGGSTQYMFATQFFIGEGSGLLDDYILISGIGIDINTSHALFQVQDSAITLSSTKDITISGGNIALKPTSATFDLGTDTNPFDSLFVKHIDGPDSVSFSAPILLNGDAKVTKHIDISGASLGKGGTAPAEAFVGNYVVFEFTIGDDAVYDFVLPKDRDTTTDLIIYVDWAINEAFATNSGEVQWQVDYTISEEGDAVDGAGTTITSGDVNIPATANTMIRTTIGTIEATNIANEAVIGVKISRIAINDGSNPVAEPYALDSHLHYTADRLGE